MSMNGQCVAEMQLKIRKPNYVMYSTLIFKLPSKAIIVVLNLYDHACFMDSKSYCGWCFPTSSRMKHYVIFLFSMNPTRFCVVYFTMIMKVLPSDSWDPLGKDNYIYKSYFYPSIFKVCVKY